MSVDENDLPIPCCSMSVNLDSECAIVRIMDMLICWMGVDSHYRCSELIRTYMRILRNDERTNGISYPRL